MSGRYGKAADRRAKPSKRRSPSRYVTPISPPTVGPLTDAAELLLNG